MADFTYAELAGLWIEAKGDPQQAGVAAAVAEAESGGDPTKINNTAYPNLPGYNPVKPGDLPEYSVGLWQINIVSHPGYTQAQMEDPVQNAAAAVAISRNGTDFGFWTTYTSGAYRQYVQANFTPTIPTIGPGLTTTTGGLSSGTGGTKATIQVSQAWLRLQRSMLHTGYARMGAVATARTRIRRAVR